MGKDCRYEDKTYKDGDLLKLTGERLLCNDGAWEKQPDRPGSGIIIAPGKDMSEI